MERVSIIIPCKRIDELTKKCISECLKLDYDNFEILVLPDYKNKEKFKSKKLRIIETGDKKPAFKRNFGMLNAKGKYYAFIDSDAYPRRDWLKNAVKYFEDEKIGLVGGSNLTPLDANIAEKISGYVLSNFFVSGRASIRYKIARNRCTKELPSCNYIVRAELSPKYIDGFLTAEDSKFCFDISDKRYKIFYANDVVVFHHRRDSIWKHLKQMFVYGRDIAWLTKREFSFDKLYYSIMGLFVVGFLAGLILSLFFKIIGILFFIFMIIYILIMFVTSIKENLKMSLAVFAISIATHFAWGIGYIYGIFSKQNIVQKSL